MKHTYDVCVDLLETRGQMSVRPKGFDEEVLIHDVCAIDGDYQVKIFT
jgi:hypothetical protein